MEAATPTATAPAPEEHDDDTKLSLPDPSGYSTHDEYFATRCYGDLTMPAGRYTAVKVVIGEGAGHNWWCVMFPPLCLPAVSEKTELDAYYTEDGVTLTKTNPGYEPRFKIAEWYEKLSSLIAD